MIPHKKNKNFESFFVLYVTYLLRKHFYKIHIDQSEVYFSQEKGQLLLPNHSNWWDSLLSFYLGKKIFHVDSYGMMGEEGLKKFPFFRRIGTFSVNTSSPKGILESLNYSIKLLNERKAVWIFPQGKEEFLEKRPLHFSNGSSFIMDRSENIDVTLIAYYYTYTHYQLPEIYIKIQRIPLESIGVKKENRMTTLSNQMEGLLDKIKDDLSNENYRNYRTIFHGKRSLSEWLLILRKKRK